MQLEIDFTALARTTDPATSHIAASGVNVADSHRLVLEVLEQASEPLTSWEVWDRIGEGISGSRVRGALSELKREGRVRVVDREGLTPLDGKCQRYAKG